jgi:DNA modification methylase
MRWLVRLMSPEGGTVLDPLMGSGTTGVACVLERREFVGIEREPEYLEIARARIDAATRQGVLL